MKSRTNICSQFGSTVVSWVPRCYPESWSPRFPAASYIPGNFFLGKATTLVNCDGRGLDYLIDREAKPLALMNEKSGRSYWYIGPYRIGMLITRPQDVLAMVSKNNWANIYLHDSTESFKTIFGENSIFAQEFGAEEYRETRKRFVNVFLDPKQLREDTPFIQDAATAEIAKIQEQGVVNVNQYASASTMKTIGKLKLGFEKFGEEKKEIKSVEEKISKTIHDASVELASGKMQVAKKLLPGCFSNIIFRKSRLAKLLKEGDATIRENLIHPNRKTILSKTNWLNSAGSMTLNLDTEEITNKIREIFVAGHDTTKVLLRATLMLLADSQYQHQEQVDKLRHELDSLPGKPHEWTYDDIKRVDRLDWIVNESLRLYPPVPDMNFGIKQAFRFGDGMLYPGDTVFISPRVIHRHPKIWGQDAHLFRPERFKNFDFKENAGSFFPFGFFPKDCPGQNFARLKVKITIARWIAAFDFKFVNENYHHPFDYNQVFTLHFAEQEVPIQVTPRRSQTLTPAAREFQRMSVG